MIKYMPNPIYYQSIKMNIQIIFRIFYRLRKILKHVRRTMIIGRRYRPISRITNDIYFLVKVTEHFVTRLADRRMSPHMTGFCNIIFHTINGHPKNTADPIAGLKICDVNHIDLRLLRIIQFPGFGQLINRLLLYKIWFVLITADQNPFHDLVKPKITRFRCSDLQYSHLKCFSTEINIRWKILNYHSNILHEKLFENYIDPNHFFLP